MRPSNVQTKSIVFAGLDIQPIAGEGLDASNFDWDDVSIGIHTNHQKGDGNTHFLYLRFIVENEEGKTAPYTMDVQAMGLFEFIGTDTPEKVTDLVVVNGLSILYGAIREMTTVVTSRMPHGAICLPGANFLDHRPSIDQSAGASKASVPSKKAGQRRATAKKSK